MALADIPVALVEAARRGERQAIERLLRLVSPDVYRIIYSMLRDHDDTDEVVQETLVRLFRYLSHLKEPDRFAAWTMRIAVNQVQTWRVRNRRQRLYQMEEGEEPDEDAIVFSGAVVSDPRRLAERREIRAEIERAMAALPDRQQTAMVLYELEGCSIKEIAESMGCSKGAVKFNLHEARKKLRVRLAGLVQSIFGRTKSAEGASVGDS